MSAWARAEGKQTVCKCSLTIPSVRALARSVKQHCERASGNGKHTWMARLEGRHGRRSGMWFVDALTTVEGAKGFIFTARHVQGVLDGVMRPGFDHVMNDDSLTTLLTAAQDQLALASRKSKSGELVVERAGPYNSVDLGRWLVIWLVSTKRMGVPIVSHQNYDVIMKGMSSECKDAMQQGGVMSADDLMAKSEILNKLAVSSTPSPAKFEYTNVFWPCVLIHLCEVGQMLRDLVAEDLERVLSAHARVTTSAVQARTASLQNEERNSLGCHAVLVTRAAVQACDEHHKEVVQTTLCRFREPAPGKAKWPAHTLKRPAQHSGRARLATLKKPAMMMACPICGAEVRNDVIARHMQTPKCKRAVLQVTHQPSSEA